MREITEQLCNKFGAETVKYFCEHRYLLQFLDNDVIDNCTKEAECKQAWEDFNRIIEREWAYVPSDGGMYSQEHGFFNEGYWFDRFLLDYEKAAEEAMNIPSDRELCILRIAREAVYKRIPRRLCPEFVKAYLHTPIEETIFWTEYYIHYYEERA